ncbi:unnamed protein product [Rotaria magnacalcarata]|uniref:Uncharacterized protein n=1 Tax=Rotaria magnacalcarata TaxID=392030 RepID=A0A8S3FR90_9BILA|nr:unnamed protein product [Rotaria magnacalcarata]
MESNSFVNLNQSTALKELPKFTGDPQQKVTQFIDEVERIGIFTELNESLIHSIEIFAFYFVCICLRGDEKGDVGLSICSILFFFFACGASWDVVISVVSISFVEKD